MGLLDLLQSTIEEREDNYDNPLPNFLRIALYWSIWKQQVFNPLDVIFMMDLMKTAREQHNHNNDTLLDKTGYVISCYERIDERMKALGYEGAEAFRSRNGDTDGGTGAIAGLNVGWMYEVLLENENYEAEHRGTSSELR